MKQGSFASENVAIKNPTPIGLNNTVFAFDVRRRWMAINYYLLVNVANGDHCLNEIAWKRLLCQMLQKQDHILIVTNFFNLIQSRYSEIYLILFNGYLVSFLKERMRHSLHLLVPSVGFL